VAKRVSQRRVPPPAKTANNPKEFVASVYQAGDASLPNAIVVASQAVERVLGVPVWLMIQNNRDARFGSINRFLARDFHDAISKSIPPAQPIALMIDSPGGDADGAFQFANIIRRHCGRFSAIVPAYAKSAATLLCLGADHIFMGSCAELGPLDAQIGDSETEDERSVLEYVQALERLEAYTLRLVDDSMNLLIGRTGKKVSTLLPQVMEFATKVVRPLYEKVDVVQYAQMARILKVAEDYAVRMLSWNYPSHAAEAIARELVSKYSDHGYIIDSEEATNIGLTIEPLPADLRSVIDAAGLAMRGITAFGKLTERAPI
jgi:hypothetical protein